MPHPAHHRDPARGGRAHRLPAEAERRVSAAGECAAAGQKARRADDTGGRRAAPFRANACGIAGITAGPANSCTRGRRGGVRRGGRNRVLPAPRRESTRWTPEGTQQRPRAPRPFAFSIRLPQSGPKKMNARSAACDRPRGPRREGPLALSATAHLAISRSGSRRAGKTPGALLCRVEPPAPVKPPAVSLPTVVMLRHPLLAIHPGSSRRSPRVEVRMPEPGMAGMRFTPPQAATHPAPPASVAIVQPKLAMPSVGIGVRPMLRPGNPRGGQRSGLFPEGFRRRQYYSWEALERFCGVGFQTIAGHRAAIRTVAEPGLTGYANVSRAGAIAVQDAATAERERRRPAPPFVETISLPRAMAGGGGVLLRYAPPGRLKDPILDSRHHFPALRSWEKFCRQAARAQPGAHRNFGSAVGKRYGSRGGDTRLGQGTQPPSQADGQPVKCRQAAAGLCRT